MPHDLTRFEAEPGGPAQVVPLGRRGVYALGTLVHHEAGRDLLGPIAEIAGVVATALDGLLKIRAHGPAVLTLAALQGAAA